MFALLQIAVVIPFVLGSLWVLGVVMYLTVAALFATSFFVMICRIPPWPKSYRKIPGDIAVRLFISLMLAVMFPALPLIVTHERARAASRGPSARDR